MPKTIERNGNIITEYEGVEAQEFMNNWMMEVTETDNMEDAHTAFVGQPGVEVLQAPHARPGHEQLAADTGHDA